MTLSNKEKREVADELATAIQEDGGFLTADRVARVADKLWPLPPNATKPIGIRVSIDVWRYPDIDYYRAVVRDGRDEIQWRNSNGVFVALPDATTRLSIQQLRLILSAPFTEYVSE